MIKQLWIALAMGSAVFAGIAVALAGPGAGWAQASPEQLSAVGISSGLTAALLVLFVLVFLGLAVADGIAMFQARRHIDAALRCARAGEPAVPGDFIAAMGRGMLHDAAESYAVTLRRASRDGDRYIGADPSDFFPAERLIGDRLFLTAFRRLPTLLVLLSAAALAYGLHALLATYGQGASAVVLAANGQAVLVACAFPLFGAVLVGAILPAVVAIRRRQLATLVARIGVLFHGADEQVYIRRLLEAQHDGAADLRRGVGVAVDEIRKLFESLRRRVEEQTAARPGNAFERTLVTGLTDLSGAVARLSEQQDQAVGRLVEQSLTRFNEAAGAAIAEPMARIETILRTTESATAALGSSVDAAARVAHDTAARLDAASTGIASTLDQVVERLGQVAGALNAAAERHVAATERSDIATLADRFDRVGGVIADQVAGALSAAAERRSDATDGAGVAALAERLDRIGGALTEQVEESRAASAAMKQLQAGVDSLGLSVAPVLNRLVDTQDDLQTALSGEHSTSRLLADVAEDLRQLSRTNRETLERHAQLATDMLKVGEALGTLVGAPAQPRPVPPFEVSDGLMRALRELKQDSEDAARSLPSLEPAA